MKWGHQHLPSFRRSSKTCTWVGAELEIHLISMLTIYPLNIKRKIITVKSGETLALLPREAVSAPSLEVQGQVGWGLEQPEMVRAGKWVGSEVLSNLIYSMI